MSEEQPLNSLDRFRKQSNRLVLEVHSSCEVPAGCGGVILRWRNPQIAIPVAVTVYRGEVEGEVLLDGEPLARSRFDLVPGPHQFALCLKNVDFSGGILMMSISYNPDTSRSVKPSRDDESTVHVLSAVDNTWKCTTEDPGDGDWTAIDYDESDWEPLVGVTSPTLEWNDPGGYQGRQLNELGATFLGLNKSLREQKHGNVWIRKRFDLPAATSHEPRS